MKEAISFLRELRKLAKELHGDVHSLLDSQKRKKLKDALRKLYFGPDSILGSLENFLDDRDKKHLDVARTQMQKTEEDINEAANTIEDLVLDIDLGSLKDEYALNKLFALYKMPLRMAIDDLRYIKSEDELIKSIENITIEIHSFNEEVDRIFALI